MEGHQEKEQRSMRQFKRNRSRRVSIPQPITQDMILYMTQNLFEYDWSPEMRGQLLSQISESLFWYMVDTTYFALKSQEMLKQLQQTFNALIHINFSKNQLNTELFTMQCQKLIFEKTQNELDISQKTRMSQVTIQELIDKLSEEKVDLQQKARENFEKFREIVQEQEIQVQQSMALSEIEQSKTQEIFLSETEQRYLSYLERNHVNQEADVKENQKQPKKQIVDDILCHICNDGDYLDSNLIVICSKCNLSVHQKCYGIENIPQDDWICDLCRCFKKSGMNVGCLLCSCASGPLKQTNLKLSDLKDSEEFKNLNEPYVSIHSNGVFEEISDETNSEGLYYDFNKNQKYLKLNKPTKSEHVWVHMSCAAQSTNFILEKVKKQIIIKYQKEKQINLDQGCFICDKKSGQSFKCANQSCEKYFHVECARRQNYFHELSQETSQNVKIFCKQHTPLKLRRILEQNKNQAENEIYKFLTNFESHVQFQKQDLQVEEEPVIENLTEEEVKHYQHFSQKFKEFYFKLPQNQFYIDYTQIKSEKNKYKILELHAPKKVDKYFTQIKENDPIWRHFKYKKLNKKQCFRKYQEIIRLNKQEKDNQEDQLRKSKLQQSYIRHNKQKFSNIQDLFQTEQFEEQQDFNIYCICKKLYSSGEDMMQCEKCDNWYHYDCIGYKGTEQQASQLDFVCEQCEKQEDPEQVRERDNKMFEIFQSWLFDYKSKLYCTQDQDYSKSTLDDQEFIEKKIKLEQTLDN